jgi:hypothetical protein
MKAGEERRREHVDAARQDHIGEAFTNEVRTETDRLCRRCARGGDGDYRPVDRELLRQITSQALGVVIAKEARPQGQGDASRSKTREVEPSVLQCVPQCE